MALCVPCCLFLSVFCCFCWPFVAFFRLVCMCLFEIALFDRFRLLMTGFFLFCCLCSTVCGYSVILYLPFSLFCVVPLCVLLFAMCCHCFAFVFSLCCHSLPHGLHCVASVLPGSVCPALRLCCRFVCHVFSFSIVFVRWFVGAT